MPCTLVRTRWACSTKIAQAFVDERSAVLQRIVEACEARDPSRTNCEETYSQGHTVKTLAEQGEWNLDRVIRGFPLLSAECIGAGTGITRFKQLRCKVAVEDFFNKGGKPMLSNRLIVSGRVLVTVSGKTTFRWSLI
jgi:hypothetical protein